MISTPRSPHDTYNPPLELQDSTEPLPIQPDCRIHVAATFLDLPKQLFAYSDELISMFKNLKDEFDTDAPKESHEMDTSDEAPTGLSHVLSHSPSCDQLLIRNLLERHVTPEINGSKSETGIVKALSMMPNTLCTPNQNNITEENDEDVTAPLEGRPDMVEVMIHPYQNEKWMANYRILLQYQREYGHCHVPFHYKENPALSQWVKRQRHQHKCWSAGKHSHLNKERIQMLEMAGFTWDSHASAWEQNFQTMKQYKKQHGNCHVPVAYPKLSTWVKRQRRQYRRFVLKQPSAMTTDRIQRLVELGITLETRC